MTRNKRHKKIRKIKTLFWSAYAIGLGGFGSALFIVFTFLIPISTITMFKSLLLLMSFMIPLIIGLALGMYAGMIRNDLFIEFKQIQTERNKNYVRRFFKHIQKQEYIQAIDIHNDFINGKVKLLTRGILIGSLYFKGNDKFKKQSISNMKEIVDIEM
jgi:hypothetical protein